MQITTGRQATKLNKTAKRPTQPAPEPPAGPPEPADSSRLSAAHQTGKATAARWNGKYGNYVGGVIGVAATLPALYAGLIGGGVAGAVAGFGFGPAVGVLKGADGFGLVKSVFETGGTVAKGVMVAGAAAAVVGGFVAGRKVGEAVSAVPLSAVAYPVGFTKGLVSGQAPDMPEKPTEDGKVELVRRPRGLTKGAAGLLGGVGAISGGIGGAALGAGAAGGISLLAGVLAGDVTMASLGTAALVGGGIGAALGGTVAGIGGFTIATKTADAASWVKNKVAPDKEGQALEDLRQKVADKQEDFSEISQRLDQATDHAATDFTRRQSELEDKQKQTREYVDSRELEAEQLRQDGRNYEANKKAELDTRQAELDQADQAIERTIEADALKRFDAKRAVTDAKYADLHQELDGVRDAHQERDDHITGIENEQAAEIEAKVVDSYNQKMVPVKEHYADLHAVQDDREAKLKKWDGKVVAENQRLDGIISKEGMADFKQREPGLEAEYRGHTSDLRDEFKDKTKAANRDHSNKVDQADQRYRQDISDADSQHSSNMRQADVDHKRAVEREQSQHSQAMRNEDRSHDQAMSQLNRDHENRTDRLDRDHKKKMASLGARQGQLQGEKRKLSSEKPRLESNLSQAKRELSSAKTALRNANSRWDREVGDAERDRDAAVRERNSAASEVSSTKRAASAAESEKSKWVRQKAKVDALIPGLRSERDRLKRVLDKLKG